MKMANEKFINNNANMIIACTEMKEYLPEVSKLLYLYFKQLKESGFDDNQALQLTIGFQRTLFGLKQ